MTRGSKSGDDILGVGAVVKFQDFEWMVEECWEWK
jgi:hypothetical protein